MSDERLQTEMDKNPDYPPDWWNILTDDDVDLDMLTSSIGNLIPENEIIFNRPSQTQPISAFFDGCVELLEKGNGDTDG